MSGKTKIILQSRQAGRVSDGTRIILQNMQNQNKPWSQKYMSRAAEITRFSFGEEAEEHRTPGEFYGRWGKMKAADVCSDFPPQIVPWTIYSYQYKLKWLQFSGIVHL